jgi:hypothetical protein
MARLRVWKVLEIGTASSSHSKKLNWNKKVTETALKPAFFTPVVMGWL